MLCLKAVLSPQPQCRLGYCGSSEGRWLSVGEGISEVRFFGACSSASESWLAAPASFEWPERFALRFPDEEGVAFDELLVVDDPPRS